MSRDRDKNNQELILTDIKSDSNRDLVALYYSNNGKLLVKHPDHLFMSRHFSSYQTLDEVVREAQKISRAQISFVKKNRKQGKPFNIAHIKGKPSLGKQLRAAFNTHFDTKNYTQTAREHFGGPGTIHQVESTTMTAIKRARSHNTQLRDLKQSIIQAYPERNKAYHTRIFNELTKAAHAKEPTTTLAADNKYLNTLPKKIIEQRDTLQEVFRTLKTQPGISTNIKKNGEIDVLLEHDHHVKPKKSLEYLTLYNNKWAHLDIEIPLWNTTTPENSWVVIYYENKGRVYKKEIHTASDVGSDEFDGQEVFCYHGNIADLVVGVKRSIQRENPLVMTAHNGNFDYTKLRETPELKSLEESFTPDQEDIKEPVRDATTKFFERINLQSRLFIDFLRFAQIQYAYLPNKKLNLVAKVILGEKTFDKELTYDEMKELELVARRYDNIKGDEQTISALAQIGKSLPDIKQESVVAAQKIASYAGKDVAVLAQMKRSAVFSNFLMRITELATEYNLPLEHLAYSTRTVLKINERAFTRRTGADYNKLFLSGKNSRKEYSNNKQHFRTILDRMGDVVTTSGLYEDVHLMYLRYGHALRHIITRSVPEVTTLFNKKARSKEDSYLLSRYGNAFAEWLITDYAKIDKLQRAIEKKEGKLHKKIPVFEALYEQQKMVLQQTGKTVSNNLFHGNLSETTVEQNVLPAFTEYADVSVKDITFLLNKRQKLSKATYKFEQQFQTTPQRVRHTLESLVQHAKEFITDNNMRLLHQEGPYFYVQGDTQQLQEKYEHMIVQSFNDVLITRDVEKKFSERNGVSYVVGEQKLLYNLFGYYKGFKFVDHPTHYLNVHEMNQFHQFFELYKERRHEEALTSIVDHYKKVLAATVPIEQLVLHSKASERYTVFEKGQKMYFKNSFPEGTTYEHEGRFISPTHAEKDILFDDETNRYYTTELINGSEEKVFIAQLHQLRPDWSLYQQSQEKRIRNLLHGLIGESIEELFDNPDSFPISTAAGLLRKTHQ